MNALAWARARELITARSAAIMIAALVLAWLSLVSAASEALGARAPNTLAGLAPGEIKARLKPFDSWLAKNPAKLFGGRPPSAVVAQSRFVLSHVPLHAGAVRWLGMDGYGSGDKKAGERLIALSNSLTRRNASVQLLMAGNAARDGDATGAFHHLDILMRTHGEQGPMLFPQMASFLGDAQFRKSFVPYVRNRAPWLEDFLLTAVEDGKNPIPIAETLADAGGLPDSDAYRRVQGQLLSQVAEVGSFGTMRRLQATFPPRIRQQLDSSGFNAATTSPDYAPLAWRAYENPESGASFIMADQARRAGLVSSTGRGTAKVLDRVFFAAPGRYRLLSRGKAEVRAEGDTAYWRVACTGKDGAVLVDGKSNFLGKPAIAQFFDFTVPSGCTSFYAEMYAKAGTAAGLEFYLDDIVLTRVGA